MPICVTALCGRVSVQAQAGFAPAAIIPKEAVPIDPKQERHISMQSAKSPETAATSAQKKNGKKKKNKPRRSIFGTIMRFIGCLLCVCVMAASAGAVLLSLYVVQVTEDPDGKLDLEHIQAIDTELFRRNLRDLLRGREVELPSFNFVTGRREWRGRVMRLEPDTVMIVEGLHALNPALLPADLDRDSLFRMYVSPLLPLNLDNHNRIPTSYLRLLRRIVRDYETRGSSVEQTVDMWDSVRRGEHRWIYPFQEQADVIFNSSTLYELAVLKKHIFPLLTAVGPEQSCYDTVRGAVKILNFVEEADVDDEIPPTSLVREFIGGNSFYRK